jgi:hypothetical protein
LAGANQSWTARSLPLPALYHRIYDVGNGGSCFVSVDAASKERIVFRLNMADVSTHGKVNRVLVEALRRSSSTDSFTVFATSVFSDTILTAIGTIWVATPHFFRKSPNVFAIGVERALSATTCLGRTGRCVFETCRLGCFERCDFDKQTLAFVALPGPAPLQYDSPKC